MPKRNTSHRDLLLAFISNRDLLKNFEGAVVPLDPDALIERMAGFIERDATLQFIFNEVRRQMDEMGVPRQLELDLKVNTETPSANA